MLACCCIRDLILFDMQHDLNLKHSVGIIVATMYLHGYNLKKLNFEFLTPPPGSGGGGWLFAKFQLHS